MKRILVLILLLVSIASSAQIKDSVINYVLPDSVKTISFMADIIVHPTEEKQYWRAGIKVDGASLFLTNYRGRTSFWFHADAELNQISRGLNTGFDLKNFDVTFSYPWNVNDTCRLLIAQATDSAANFSLYSGYIFLPKEKKWKWMGTGKIMGRWNSIQKPSIVYYYKKKNPVSINELQVWCQRQNGSWKNMLQTNFTPPVVNLYSHVDSLEQLSIEKKIIQKAITPSTPFAPHFPYETPETPFKDIQGVYYAFMKEGTGKQVSVNDVVVAYYKGMLLDGSVFDSTKDKPATFPLNRLIKGWQIGVPLCKVGGKIKLIIPSNLGYSIRTRAAKIPPNSILVFEIEVVDAKSPQ